MSKSMVGIGLRHEHYKDISEAPPRVDWLEIHTENYLDLDSYEATLLREVAASYPISFHGIGLSLGSSDGLDEAHLKRIKNLSDAVPPMIMSEHLSWSRIDGKYVPDLLPLPYNAETLDVMCYNIAHAQDYLGRKLLIENPSSYLSYKISTMAEEEFLNKICDITGCGLLLDINNIYVSSHNLGRDAKSYLKNIDSSKVGELHLAGHSQDTTPGSPLLIDTHDQFICKQVWGLYEYAIQVLGPSPTLIEWDTKLPALSQLVDEANKARTIMSRCNAQAA